MICSNYMLARSDFITDPIDMRRQPTRRKLLQVGWSGLRGPTALSNFSYAGPLTEAVQLGTIAIPTGKKLVWDAPNMNVTNAAGANEYVRPQYREGWAL